MSPLAGRVGAGVLALLALIALRGKSWAYLAFVVLGLLYFPAQTHFRVHAPKCEQLLPTIQVLVLSLHDYAHIALFAGFYWMSWVQFRRSGARSVWALLATLLVGALVEIAEGMTGRGHCRVRDLVPDAAGAAGGVACRTARGRWARRCCSLSGPGSAGNRPTSDSSGLTQRPLDSRPRPPPVLSFLRAVSFRPRPPGVYRGCTYLRPLPRTFHRAQALSRQRRTWLRRRRSRRRGARRSRRVQRSCNACRRCWDVSGKC